MITVVYEALTFINYDCSDMSSAAFIDPLPVIEFVAQILGKDVSSKPLSDADRIKVCFCKRVVLVHVNFLFT